MNLADFLNHYQLTENPFRGEEARSDAVFARMRAPTSAGESLPSPPASAPAFSPSSIHSDFEKILGDLRRPASSVVFGEKGSGKTAIRIQIAERLARHNQQNPAEKLLFFPYDDLNGVLDRFHERVGGASPLDSFNKMKLVDHVDAVLSQIVPRLVDALLEQPASTQGAAGADPIALSGDARSTIARLDKQSRRDLLLLQAVYDRPESVNARTKRLQSRLKIRRKLSAILADAIAFLAPFAIAALAIFEYFFAEGELKTIRAWWLIAALGAVWLLFLIKRLAIDRLIDLNLGRKVRKQLRVVARGDVSYSRSLRRLDAAHRVPSLLPSTDSDEARYAMLERLLRILRPLGYAGLVIVVDRVDEPTLVNGDPERMRAIIWPLLNNKFLQHAGLGVKMLLPIELRHLLFKESSAFFQEARLDKQNLVERLSWSGASLYDLCESRLAACRPASAPPLSLRDLFEDDVTKDEIAQALDQMHQPRDAFKLLYRCMSEHCAGVTRDAGSFKIAALLLETVKRQESERVQALHRGIRPA